MTTCPFKIRKRDSQELTPCDKKPNYVVTVEGFPPFRACVIHSTKYKKAGAQVVYKALERGVADSIPQCDDPPPVPRPRTEEEEEAPAPTSAATSVATAVSTTTPPLSIGLNFTLPTPEVDVRTRSRVKKAVGKSATAEGPAASKVAPATPSGPPPVMLNNRVEVMDKLLHPIYSNMFAAACNMRVRQKASTRYSKADTQKVLSLGSLKEDDMERAIIQGKAARKAVAGEKALEELEMGGPPPPKKGPPPAKRKGLPAPATPVAPPMIPPTMMAPPPPMMPMMNMMPQMVVPTYYAPTPARSIIDAPAPPIIVGPSGMQLPPEGEPIPQQQHAPIAQPPQGEGGMVADANGVLRFQGGVQADGSAPDIQPRQPERLTGNALLMAARQNRKGILGCLTVVESVVGALGFPGAIGTTDRLARDPSFTQCIMELLDPTPEADGGTSNGAFSFLDIHEGDHGVMKTLKLYIGHLANNALNYGTGKAVVALAPSVLKNAQASLGSPSPSPATPPGSGDSETNEGSPPDAANEMLPREEASGDGDPPIPMPMGGQMFMIPFAPSSYLVVPTGSAPVDPLHKKDEPTAVTPISAADHSSLLEAD